MAVFAQGLQVSRVVVLVVIVNMVHIELPGMDRDKPTCLAPVLFILPVLVLRDMQLF
jgi:hypothetical protein